MAERLGERGVLVPTDANLFKEMAGYRNRLVHFYDRVSEGELYAICTDRLGDIEMILVAIHEWIRRNPDRIDHSL